MRFSVHPFAAAGLFLLLFASPREYAFAVCSSVLLHELGHAAAALLFHGKIKSIRLMPTGIGITLSPAASYREEFFVAAAGPLMNLAYIALSPLLPTAPCETVRSISAILMSVNLLPISTLDGGRMLRALISHTLGENAAEKALSVTTVCALSLLWILSLYIFFYSSANFTLLLFCAYLFSYLFIKKL